MDSIVELEKRVMQNVKKAAPEDLDILARHYWDLATRSNDYRDKRKHLKRSCFFVGLAFAAGADSVEQLELYRTIILRGTEVASSPGEERRKLSRIIARWLEKTGADKQEVLAKAKGRIPVDCGLISLGDRARFAPSDKDWYFDAQIVERTNRGERLTFATGGDGLYPAELRLIDAVEPVLTAREYKRLGSSTPTVVIEVASGALGMAEYVEFLDKPWDKQEIEGAVCLNVPPGRYKACAFGFSSRTTESVIAVVTATPDEPRNETQSVDNLFG
jgi:hypothetical protein